MKIDTKELMDFIEKNNTKSFKVTGVIYDLHERTIIIHSDKTYEMVKESKNDIISGLTKVQLDEIRRELNLRKYDLIDELEEYERGWDMKIDVKELVDFIEENNADPFKVSGIIDGLHEITILIYSNKTYEMVKESKNDIFSGLTKTQLDEIRRELNLRKYNLIDNY